MEIDLLFEEIHLENLDGKFVAELDSFSGAAADEVVALGIENIEIVLNAGERDKATHGEVGNINEETEVADIGNEGLVGGGAAALELLFEIGEKFDVLAVALGVRGIAFGGGDVVRGVVHEAPGEAGLVKQGAVDDEVGVAANGRGEVGVFGLGETVMAERLGGVAGTHEGLEETDLERLADGNLVEARQQFLDFGAAPEVTARDVMGEDFLAIFHEAFFVRLLVDAVDGGLLPRHEAGGDSFIGEEHEFLDELMGNVVLDLLDAKDAALFIEADFAFGEIEFESASLKASAADFLGEIVGLVEHGFDGTIGFSLQEGEDFLVAVAALGVDDGGVEFRFEDFAVIADEELDAFGKAIDIRFERTEFVAERLGEHGNDAVDEVGGIAALAGLDIERGAGFDIMGDVRDVDPKAPAVAGALEVESVIEILGVVGVNGDDLVRAAIGAAFDFVGLDFGTEAAGVLEHFAGKMEREIVLAEDAEHVHAFGVGRAKDFDDFAFGIDVPGLPLAKFDDDFVADVGRAADIARRGDVDVLGHARVVRNDVKELLGALESADDLHAAAFENANDLACAVAFVTAAEATRTDIEADEDAVFVKGGGSGGFGDDDFLELRIVGLEEAFAATVHADAAGDEIGFDGTDEAVTLDASDAAFLLKGAEGALEFAAAVRFEAEFVENVSGCERHVTIAAE